MLQVMRELAKSWIFKSLLALLVVSFGAWGIGRDMFSGNPAQRTVAEVGKVKIPVHALETRFQFDLPQAREVFGPNLTADQARQIGVLDRTLKFMTEETLFDLDAARLGIAVKPEFVMRRLANEPRLRDKDGKFNTQLWQQLLQKTGYSEQAFLDIEGRNTARHIIAAAIASNASPPTSMIDNLYQARGDKRLFEIITLRNDSLKHETTAPKDEELKSYYEEHQNEFVAPEYRGITIARISNEDITKDAVVTDDDARQAYETRAPEFTQPETRDLIQIVVQDEAKAKDIAAAGAQSKNLTTTAKAKGLTPITMNKIDEKAILPELFTTVFALEEGQVSPAVKSPLGWHVIQLKKINQGGLPPFETIRADITKILKEERSGDLIAKTVNRLDDALAGGEHLENVADELKLFLTRYAAVDIKGMDDKGHEVKDIPGKDRTLPAAFEMGSNETGQVLDDGKGNYFVVRVDQISPSKVRAFEEVRSDILNSWIAEQLATKAAKLADEIANELRDGKSATSFATRPGVDVRLSKPVSLLGEMDKDLPKSTTQDLFAMKKGDVTTAPASGKHLVLRLADIVPVDPKKPEASRLKVVEELSNSFQSDVLEQYMEYLRTLFPVSIHQDIFFELKNRGSESNQ